MTGLPHGGSGASRLPPARTPFKKPWKNWSDQLKMLEDRGLMVADRAAAEAFLSHVNYYRLSGYCLAFETTRHVFEPGTTWEQIQGAYDFDRLLRDLVTEALEVVEVDVRTSMAYHFGHRYGAFGHVDPSNFFRTFRHSEWLTKIHDETNRSSELFVQHFKAKHVEYPNRPVWIVTEVMSFGGLSHMFSGMIRDDQRNVAQRYAVQPSIFSSWLHHLVYVRNVCAHHSRVWDRVWSIKPELPPIPAWSPPYLPGNDRLFATLLILKRLLGRCPSASAFASEWKFRVETHVASPPQVKDALARMGMTTGWRAHPYWK